MINPSHDARDVTFKMRTMELFTLPWWLFVFPLNKATPETYPQQNVGYTERCNNNENIGSIFQIHFQGKDGSQNKMGETVGLNESKEVQSVPGAD